MLVDMEITPRRRRAFATALAFVLAIESVSAVAAAGLATTAIRTPPRGADADRFRGVQGVHGVYGVPGAQGAGWRRLDGRPDT